MMERLDMYYTKSLKVLSYATIALLLSLVIIPISCDSATVWLDDFNDEDYNSWTIYGLDFTSLPPSVDEGDFSAADKTLKATGSIYNYAAHPSSVAYGTWSFDVFAVDTPTGYCIVFFMVSDFSQIETLTIQGYSISVCTDAVPSATDVPGFLLGKHGTGGYSVIANYDVPDGISGWQHIVVTRSESGLFAVYVNDTAQISTEDTTYTTSVDFCFGSDSGQAIDNVVVSDTVDYPETDLTLIILFSSVAIVVVVILVIYFIRFRR